MSRLPSLDDIIQATRQEAARPEYQIGNIEALLPPQALFATATGGQRAAGDGLGASARVGHVNQLLLISEPTAFIAAAYESILHRPADALGAQQYLEKLQQGYGQCFVIAALAASAEAQEAHSRLPGRGLSSLPYNVWRVARRLGLGGPARLFNLAYSAWRHLLLAASGQLLSFTQQTGQRVGQQLDQKLHRESEILHQLQSQAEARQLAAEEQQQKALGEMGAQTRALRELVQNTQRDLQLVKARTNLLQQLALPPAPQGQFVQDASAQPDAATALEERIDAYYLAFEEANRGTQEEIAAKLRVYLDQVSQLPANILTLPMVDIGCGRGEWTQMLVQNGFKACGIDVSPRMVRLCQNKGLDAQVADGLAWLAAQPDQSHALISGFHIIEHLPFPVLFQLMEHAFRVLAPGGKLVFETPNPENVLVGSHTFYHDPTHRNPITPTALNFMLLYHGFERTDTLRLHPYPASDRVQEFTLTAERLNGHLYGPQDFAVIGTRAL